MTCDRCGGPVDHPQEPVTVDGERYLLCRECRGVVARRRNKPRSDEYGYRAYGRVNQRHSGP